jgi:hypothetical protein
MGEDGVADMDPIPAGAISAEFARPLSSTVEKKDVSVVFRPRDNGVFLEFKYQGVTYRQHWDSANRKLFVEALEKYKADYERRNLDSKSGRTQRIYGVTTGMTEWGYSVTIGKLNISNTLNDKGYPSYELGYVFKRDSERRESPYFTVFQREAKTISEHSDGEDNRSLNIYIYYTRAQADELVKLFDRDYLLSLIRPAPVRDNVVVESEEY